MKIIMKRIFSMLIIGSVLMFTCIGCNKARRSPFFSSIESKYDEQDAELVLENFCEYVQNTDFTEFDYAYSQEAHIYQEEVVTEIDAYRNEKDTVFCSDTLEAHYYYNQQDGILHCDMKVNGEISDLEEKKMEWSDFPFDSTMEKAYNMLSYLCESKDYLYLEYEEKTLSDWEYQKRLSMSYWDRYNKGVEDWDNRTPEWEEQFGECGPYSISVFCNDEGTKFNCISIIWYEGVIRYTVTWNSYDAILQSERCVIRYEYDNGLCSDNVPALEEQREELKKEIENNPLY